MGSRTSPGKAKACVALDLDGVVVDSEEAKIDAFRSVFADSEHLDEIDTYNRAQRGVPRSVKFEHVARHILGENWSHDALQEIAERYAEELRRRSTSIGLIAGIERLLGTLIYEFAICSSAPISEVEQVLRRLGIRDRFSSVDGHPVSKAEALRRLRVEWNGRTVFIGDATADEHAARVAGVAFIGFGPHRERFETVLTLSSFIDVSVASRAIQSALAQGS